MHFSFADVVRAPKLGFSAKKIWIGFLGLLIGVILYSLLTYFAFVVTPEWTWKTVWQKFQYIPVPIIGVTHLTWYSWILWVVGVVLFMIVNLLSICAISKLTFEQLRGDEFYEVTEAIKFSLKNWKGNVLSPFTLVAFIAALIFIGFLVGLAGRIPYAGQILTGIFFIPIAFGAFFVIYLTIIFFVSFLLSPSIEATQQSDTFDTLFELFSVVNDQTWRLTLWEIFVAFSGVTGIYVLGWLAKKALMLTHWAVGFWQGPREWFNAMWQNGLWYLPPCPAIPWLERVVGWFLPVLISPPSWVSVNWATWIGGFLVGICFHFIAFGVVAYGIATWGAGQTLIYTVLVKIKDDKNLLERKEEEAVEEKEEIKEEKPEKEEEKIAEEKKEEAKTEEKEKEGEEGKSKTE